MHDYFKRAKDLQKAEEDLRGTIERIADECNIHINIKFRPDMLIVKAVGSGETIYIDEKGILEPFIGDLPTVGDWDIFLTKLKKQLE